MHMRKTVKNNRGKELINRFEYMPQQFAILPAIGIFTPVSTHPEIKYLSILIGHWSINIRLLVEKSILSQNAK